MFCKSVWSYTIIWSYPDIRSFICSLPTGNNCGTVPMSKAITRSLTGLIRGLEDRVWRPDDFLPDGATGILSAVLDWSQFEACGVKGAADVKDMDAVLVIKDAENNVLSKENISVSYWWWAEPVLTWIPTDSGGRNPAIWYSIKIWKKEAMLSWQLEASLLLYAVLYAVCAPWARSNGWKSQTRPGSGKCIAEQQGCPSWGGIWKKL